MALKFTLKTKRIEFADGDYVEVRGLALPDIVQLVECHTETVTGLFDRFTGRDPNSFTEEEAGSLALNLASAFPGIAAHVIALGADAIDEIDTINKLPIDVQAEALEAISNLTFAMQGGVKNFAETVTRIAGGANGLVAQMKAKKLPT